MSSPVYEVASEPDPPIFPLEVQNSSRHQSAPSAAIWNATREIFHGYPLAGSLFSQHLWPFVQISFVHCKVTLAPAVPADNERSITLQYLVYPNCGYMPASRHRCRFE